jgi:hypothetical protein
VIQRIAIVNRGEPAMRLIHAAREHCGPDGRPFTTIALHTDAERSAMFFREAGAGETAGKTLLPRATGATSGKETELPMRQRCRSKENRSGRSTSPFSGTSSVVFRRTGSPICTCDLIYPEEIRFHTEQPMEYNC